MRPRKLLGFSMAQWRVIWNSIRAPRQSVSRGRHCAGGVRALPCAGGSNRPACGRPSRNAPARQGRHWRPSLPLRLARCDRGTHAAHRYPRADRTSDQHDAYSIAAWLSQANRDSSLAGFLRPDLTLQEKAIAQVEGWILGFGGSPTQWGNLATAEVKGHA